MANRLDNIDLWLRTQCGVSCKKEWIQACLSWMKEDKVLALSCIL